MSSNFGKNENDKIIKSITNDFIAKMHHRNAFFGESDDINSCLDRMGYMVGNPEARKAWNQNFKQRDSKNIVLSDVLNNLLYEATQKQEVLLQDALEKQIADLNLQPTANPMFMKDAEGQYYRFAGYEYIKEPSVIEVDEAGSYVVKSVPKDSEDTLITTYDIANKPILMKVLNMREEAYESARYVAKRLQMKQEYVNKYKLHGYSGNASGIVAKIKNMFAAPVPTGCYLDKSYNFFKWNNKKRQFEINMRDGMQIGSPLMADYDIQDSVVVRTDYDGVGIAAK